MFPTKTATALAKASELDTVFVDPVTWQMDFAVFQRLALVADYETCVRALMPKISRKLTEQHNIVLKLIYDMAKSDVLGLAIESLCDVAEKASGKDRIAASTVLNELFGEKQLIEDVKLTDRLMINLVGGDK